MDSSQGCLLALQSPIMNNAKATLESMNLPEINKMAKMMQNINQGKRAN